MRPMPLRSCHPPLSLSLCLSVSLSLSPPPPLPLSLSVCVCLLRAAMLPAEARRCVLPGASACRK